MTDTLSPPEKLAALRAVLARDGVQGFLLTRGDAHLGEYVAPDSERLAWLTGFTGSAGCAVVLAERAMVFSDGRYVLQLETQTDGTVWERGHMIELPPERWAAAAAPGARIGYDPRLISAEMLARFERAGLVMVALDHNPVDAVWTDRPAPPLAPALPHEARFSGRDSEDKRRAIAAMIAESGADAVVLTDPASIAWLLNIRGSDVPCTPIAQGFAILRADASVTLYMAPEKLPETTRAWLGNAVATAAPERMAADLAALAGQRVRVDPAGSAVWFAQALRAAGATVVDGPDPVLLPKARKNAVEQEGARSAHLRDGIALAKFLHWLDANAAATSEIGAIEALDGFRAEAAEFRGNSFDAISGAGPDGAIIHYRVTPETDRLIGADTVYLIDSGAQYPDGTTDVTRTVWTGPSPAPDEVADAATRVLQGHIALAAAIFPKDTTGIRLDALARLPLWRAGLDYDHGTGHGIGSFLAVHEGPCSISPRSPPVPLEPGMILSDEPGYYRPGGFGIRAENLLLVGEHTPDGRFLAFETLTLAPFDRRLIATALLSPDERDWIDRYHARVLAQIGPHVPDAVRAWLASACAPL
jgi:Xaa-Pro aminopeptidase